MKVKSISTIILALFLCLISHNETYGQAGLLKKVKKEVKKSKPKKQTSTSSSQSSSPKKSPSTTSSKSKNNDNEGYKGPGRLSYNQIVKHLAVLDNCEGNIGGSGCELGMIADKLKTINSDLKQLTEKDPEYDTTEFKAAYDKYSKLLASKQGETLKEYISFEMKEYNTSSPIFNKVKFFDLSMHGDNTIKFSVTLTHAESGFEWTKHVKTPIDDFKKLGGYKAKTDRRRGDSNDRRAFFVTPPKEGKSFGSIHMTFDYSSTIEKTDGIILFGEQSHDELKAEVQKKNILYTSEEAQLTSLEKNHLGEIIFSSQVLEKTLSEAQLKNKFTLGDPIYPRIVLKEPSSSMRELFIKEGLSPNYTDSWILMEYYKDGQLIGTYKSEGFFGEKQGTNDEFKNEFDTDRSFSEPLLESDFYLYNSAAPLWRGLLEKGISNGTYKIDMKCFIVHAPSEEGQGFLKDQPFKKFVSEGSFSLTITESGKSKFCSQARVCKK